MEEPIELNGVEIVGGRNIDQTSIEKTKNLRIVIPTYMLWEGKETENFRHFVFVGFLPERVRPYGRKKIYLPREYVIGMADYNTELGEWPKDSVRFVRWPLGGSGARATMGMSRAIGWLCKVFGVRPDWWYFEEM